MPPLTHTQWHSSTNPVQMINAMTVAMAAANTAQVGAAAATTDTAGAKGPKDKGDHKRRGAKSARNGTPRLHIGRLFTMYMSGS
jgi:hypothetical protein